MKNCFLKKNPLLLICAGIYLLYTTSNLLQDILNHEIPQSNVIWIGIAAAVFAICGVVFLIGGIRVYLSERKNKSDGPEKNTDEK